MATPVLNNGYLFRDNTMQASSHLDSYHLRNMLKDAEPDDMGPVDIWAMSHKVEMPLYQLSSFSGKNTITVKNINGEFKWTTPVSQELPFIVEDIEPSNTKKGIDGQIFKIKLSKREFGHGEIITYDKMNGLELFITADDILPLSDGAIYTVQLVNKENSAYLDNKYLANGTKMFSVGSAKGEYGEKWSDITVKAGSREYYNFVGGSSAHTSYSISNKADLMLKGGMNADGTIPINEIWKNYDKNIDPSITKLEEIASKMGPDYMKRAIQNGTLSRSFITSLEAAHLSKIATNIESYLMWGKGGSINQDGPERIRLSVGLWKQLDNTYKTVYNKNGFSLELFRGALYNFYAGRVDFKGPDPNRQIIVQTGMGGMRLVNEAIKKEAVNSGLVIQGAANNGIGAITGQGMDLNFGFAFTSYTIPFLANVKFVINPAFDNLQTNDIENPIIDGNPLSSYSFIIFDITANGNDNIYLLKKEWDHQLNWFYQNGTMDYMGRTQGFASSGDFSGYKVKMEQSMPAIWVKDPTKILKITMKNPITLGSF